MHMDDSHHQKLEWTARLGYSARGAVYLIVGWLALVAAFGGGEATDTRGSLLHLMQQPAGEILLGIVALGLFAYSIWRFIQAVMDADGHGSDAKALAIRAGLLVSCITHLALGVFALSLIFGWGAGGGSGQTQDWTARLMSHTYGRWMVAGVGLAIIGAGLAHIVKGWSAKFKKHFVMDRQTMRWAEPVCQFGLMARGVVFLIIGGFFALAAWHYDPSKARGLAGALDALQQQPFGPYLLGVVALGLIAFGIYSILEAIYRRIGSPSLPSGPTVRTAH